jgi:hypothetical protein
MADTWSNPPSTGNPPVNNIDVDTNPAWQQMINSHGQDFLKTWKTRNPAAHDVTFTAAKSIEVVELPVSGEDPAPWRAKFITECLFLGM